ncbi:MAG: energy transducer TonB [Prevotellaceae bacterium]|jgi:hypothetical protein|nr:energy transducer TonB [Prevotellaceae bacterium]
MTPDTRGKYIGITGTLVIGIGILLILFLVSFTLPEKQSEDGVDVMLGILPEALGSNDPSLVPVEVLSEPMDNPSMKTSDETTEQSVITQETEETVALSPKALPEEERLRAEAEAERLRKEAINKQMNTFGKSAEMVSEENSKQGSEQGNTQDSGQLIGRGWSSGYELDGRNIAGDGTLPIPDYKGKLDENAIIVVDIIVAPNGEVVGQPRINMLKTTKADYELQNAALEAAKKARFNAVKGIHNQQGTITYYFNLTL